MELFGLVLTGPREGDARGLLTRMKSAVLEKPHRRGFLCRTFCTDKAGLGACTRSEEDGSGGTMTVNGADVFFLDGSIPEVRGETPGKESPAELVRENDLRGRFDFLNRLNGRFNLVYWNTARKSLLLATDRYGFKPVLLHRGSNVFLFSTDLDALMATGLTGTDVDEEAVHDFLNFQFVLRNRTFLKSVSVLPAGSAVRAGPDGLSEVRYWQYPSGGARKEDPLPDLIAEGSHLLEQAVHKQLPGPDGKVAVTLSGGLDSRVVSGFVARARPGVGLYHGRWHAYEAEYARMIAGVLDSPLFELDLEHPDWKALMTCCHPLTSGHLSCHQFWLTDLVRRIAADGYVRVFDGVLLDVVFQPHMLTLRSEAAGSEKEKTDAILEIYPLIADSYAQKYFPADFAVRNGSVCRNSIEEHLGGFDSDDLLEASQYFYCTGRGRGYIWPMINLNTEFIEYACPGLDHDLFDFGTALPVELRRDGSLYRKIITASFPRLAAVPSARTRLPLTEDPSPLAAKIAERVSLIKYAASRALGGKVDFLPRADYNHAFRKKPGFRAAFMEVLADERTYQRRWFSREGIENLAADIDHGKNLFSLIEAITSLELFFRRYIDR